MMGVKRIVDGNRTIFILDGFSESDMAKVNKFFESIGPVVSKKVSGLGTVNPLQVPGSNAYRYVYGPYRGKTFMESLADNGRAILYALEHVSEFPPREVDFVKKKIRDNILRNMEKRNPETDSMDEVRRFEKVFNVKPFQNGFRNVKNIAGFPSVRDFFESGDESMVRSAYKELIDYIMDYVSTKV